MFWQKKKLKRKPQKKVAPPKYIEENVKAGEHIAKGFADGIAQGSKKVEQKKSPQRKIRKLILKKSFFGCSIN